MTNNKQQTAVDILCGKLAMKLGIPQAITFYIDHQEEIREAKEMEVAGKEISYADGYAEGYKRALDYMTDTLKNKIEIKVNERNNNITSTIALSTTTTIPKQ
jgi:flagellar biosynthesis/type III secretory pathway protein FliH